MRKFSGVAIAVVLLATVTFAASAAKPKATGDADWINDVASNAQANITFNAISTNGGLDAKGSLIYTDPNINYTMDIQYLKVVGHTAWFAGQVTAVEITGIDPLSCKKGNWILYKVVDQGEPGIYADQVWGVDLTVAEHIESPLDAAGKVNDKFTPMGGGPFVINGGNIQVH